MRILNDRLNEHLHGAVPVATKGAATTSDLWEQYCKLHMPTLPNPRYKQIIAAAVELVVPSDMLLDDHLRIRAAIADKIAQRKYQPATARRTLTIIRSVFAWGIEEGLLKINPVSKAMIPRPPANVIKAYDRKDFERIAAHADDKHRPIIEFLGVTGCRVSEAAKLRWSNVHTDSVTVDGKRRRIDIPVYRTLPFALCKGLADIIAAARERHEHPDYVFGGYTTETVRRVFDAACEAAGCTYMGLHAIRRMVVSEWAASGMHERAIELLAGHKSDVSKSAYRRPLTVDELVNLASIVQASDAT